MKLTTTERNLIQLEEVYVPIILKSPTGEELVICMRDGGFEVSYSTDIISFNNGNVKSLIEDKKERMLNKFADAGNRAGIKFTENDQTSVSPHSYLL
jgi:hypothetical protein